MTAKIISLFNHKGGVSKTTTTFHLAQMLTELGKKVLMVDADPQCNLTGLTLGVFEHDTLFDFYNQRGNHDIYNSLAAAFGFPSDLNDASLQGIENPTPTKNKQLFMIAGHVDFAQFDLQIATAMTSSGSIPTLKPLLGAINHLIRKTAIRGNFDIVLIDMSPNISATNMSILMSSDYFIIPTSPDFFCYQSIESLSNVLPVWKKQLSHFKDAITLPKDNPKLLGVISQNYRFYNLERNEDGSVIDNTSEGMTEEFKLWSDKIKKITKDKLVPSLKMEEMIIDEKIFKRNVNYDEPFNLANIPNFNSLVPTSQRTSKPIFSLEQNDGNWQGALWESERNGKKYGASVNILMARDIYAKMAKAIIGMIE